MTYSAHKITDSVIISLFLLKNEVEIQLNSQGITSLFLGFIVRFYQKWLKTQYSVFCLAVLVWVWKGRKDVKQTWEW